MAFDFASTAGRTMAATGPVTAFVEAAAASVGAGMLLGGFLAGLIGLASDWDARDRERMLIGLSSLGGLAMILALLVETTIR